MYYVDINFIQASVGALFLLALFSITWYIRQSIKIDRVEQTRILRVFKGGKNADDTKRV